MTELTRIYSEADRLQAALSWTLSQWLSDVDPEWSVHVLEGLQAEDPTIFATLDAINVEDEGGPLLPGDGFVPDDTAGAATGDDRTTRTVSVVPVAGESLGGVA